jgi:hypothetical protein
LAVPTERLGEMGRAVRVSQAKTAAETAARDAAAAQAEAEAAANCAWERLRRSRPIWSS